MLGHDPQAHYPVFFYRCFFEDVQSLKIQLLTLSTLLMVLATGMAKSEKPVTKEVPARLQEIGIPVLTTVHLPNISGSGTGLLHPLVDIDRF